MVSKRNVTVIGLIIALIVCVIFIGISTYMVLFANSTNDDHNRLKMDHPLRSDDILDERQDSIYRSGLIDFSWWVVKYQYRGEIWWEAYLVLDLDLSTIGHSVDDPIMEDAFIFVENIYSDFYTISTSTNTLRISDCVDGQRIYCQLLQFRGDNDLLPESNQIKLWAGYSIENKDTDDLLSRRQFDLHLKEVFIELGFTEHEVPGQ